MQTFAFLDSLSQMVAGVGTVWIVVKSESPTTDAGYQLVDRCFNKDSYGSVSDSTSSSQSSFRVEFVSDTTNNRWEPNNEQTPPKSSTGNWKQHTLGRTVADTLRMRSSSSHVMLAVDEMIWIRPVDLRRVTQLLNDCKTGKVSDHNQQTISFGCVK